MLKIYLPYLRAKLKANKGDETINNVLLIIVGIGLVAALIAVVVVSAKNSINTSGAFINNVTEQASNAALGG